MIPIYFLALVGVMRNKKVTFKTTPKGDAAGGEEEDTLMVFKPHLILSGIIIASLAAAVTLGHTGWVFIAWGSATACLLSSFFVVKLSRRFFRTVRWKSLRLCSCPADAPIVDARAVARYGGMNQRRRANPV